VKWLMDVLVSLRVIELLHSEVTVGWKNVT